MSDANVANINEVSDNGDSRESSQGFDVSEIDDMLIEFDRDSDLDVPDISSSASSSTSAPASDLPEVKTKLACRKRTVVTKTKSTSTQTCDQTPIYRSVSFGKKLRSNFVARQTFDVCESVLKEHVRSCMILNRYISQPLIVIADTDREELLSLGFQENVISDTITNGAIISTMSWSTFSICGDRGVQYIVHLSQHLKSFSPNGETQRLFESLGLLTPLITLHDGRGKRIKILRTTVMGKETALNRAQFITLSTYCGAV